MGKLLELERGSIVGFFLAKDAKDNVDLWDFFDKIQKNHSILVVELDPAQNFSKHWHFQGIQPDIADFAKESVYQVPQKRLGVPIIKNMDSFNESIFERINAVKNRIDVLPYAESAWDEAKVRNFLYNLAVLEESYQFLFLLFSDSSQSLTFFKRFWDFCWVHYCIDSTPKLPPQHFILKQKNIYWWCKSGVAIEPKDPFQKECSRLVKGLGCPWPYRFGKDPAQDLAFFQEWNRVVFLLKNPPSLSSVLLSRLQWLFGLVLFFLVFLQPESTDYVNSKLLALKPYFYEVKSEDSKTIYFDGISSLHKASAAFLARNLSLSYQPKKVQKYVQEVLSRNNLSNKLEGRSIPEKGTPLTFYLPTQIYNPDADSLQPFYSFLKDWAEDSLSFFEIKSKELVIYANPSSRILSPIKGTAQVKYKNEKGLKEMMVWNDQFIIKMVNFNQMLYLNDQFVQKFDAIGSVNGPEPENAMLVYFGVKTLRSGDVQIKNNKYAWIPPLKWFDKYSQNLTQYDLIRKKLEDSQ